MTITYTWRFVDKGTLTPLGKTELSCVFVCKGKKHLTHKQCDLMCDKACTTLHKVTIKPIVWAMGNGFANDLSKKAYKKTGDVHVDIQHRLMMSRWGRDVMKNAADIFRGGAMGKKMTYNYKSGHWNQKPCSSSIREFKHRRWEIMVKWTVTYKDGSTMSGDSLMSTIDVPEHKPFPGKETVQCKCSIGIRYGMVPSGSLISPGVEGTENASNTTNPGGVWIDPNGEGEYAFATDLDYDTYQIKFDCQDLNAVAISATNPTMMPVGIAVLAGTQLESADSSYQDMQSVKPVRFTLPAFSSTTVRIATTGPAVRTFNSSAAVEGRIACLNMDKKEPQSGVAYTPTVSTDSRLTLLANYTATQRFGGPWDQARLWIYTDAATREEINRRLFPPVTAGSYLRGLYDVNRVAMVDLEEERYRQCMDPALLVGQSAPMEATAWFIDTMGDMNPGGLANWIKRNPLEFAHLFEPDAQEWYLAHAVTIANRLCGGASNEVALSGLDFVMRAVPKDRRDAFVESGGLDEAAMLVLVEDAELVSAALGVFETYRPIGTIYLLKNMSELLPDATKARAAKLLAELEPRD